MILEHGEREKIQKYRTIRTVQISTRKIVGIVRLTSINLQKKILKNPVFKSTICVLDVY